MVSSKVRGKGQDIAGAFRQTIASTMRSRAEQKPRLLLMGLKRYDPVTEVKSQQAHAKQERQDFNIQCRLPKDDAV